MKLHNRELNFLSFHDTDRLNDSVLELELDRLTDEETRVQNAWAASASFDEFFGDGYQITNI